MLKPLVTATLLALSAGAQAQAPELLYGRTPLPLDGSTTRNLCHAELRLYSTAGNPPSYNCLVLYAKVARNAPDATIPSAADYNQWRADRALLDETFPDWGMPGENLDSALSLEYDLYHSTRQALFRAYDQINPFYSQLTGRPFDVPATVKRIDTLLMDLQAVEAAVRPATQPVTAQALLALAAKLPVPPVVLGAPSDTLVTLFVDVTTPRSLIALTQYAALAKSGQLQLIVVPVPLTPASINSHAAFASASDVADAIDTLAMQARRQVLRAPNSGAFDLPDATKAQRNAMEQQALAVHAAALLRGTPTAVIRKAGVPDQVLMGAGALDSKGVQRPELLLTYPLPMALSPYGIKPLQASDLSGAGYLLQVAAGALGRDKAMDAATAYQMSETECQHRYVAHRVPGAQSEQRDCADPRQRLINR